MMKQWLQIWMVCCTACVSAEPVQVTVDATKGMTRGGKPYFVKGAGGETHLDMLAARGANSLRTWSTRNLPTTLAEAEKLGLTVSAGIWLASECSWFSYSNPEHCAKQAEEVKKEVLAFRDHPALLAWGLGNEAEGDGENAAYWQQLEKLAVMVKELDPNHPTFTAVAGLNPAKAAGLNKYTPHLDYVGVNTYGGLFGLRKHLDAVGWKRPWLVTEWGPQGHWESPKHRTGVPMEQTSTRKAAMMARGYDTVISKGGACLGSYAFVWGWQYEATATWFGLLTDHWETTESVDVLEEKWSGKAPANRAPTIEHIEGVPAKATPPGDTFDLHVKASDADSDSLVWRWEVLPDKPGKGKNAMPKAIKSAIQTTSGNGATIIAPKGAGVYRVYVWASDGHGHAATANAPFEVAPAK